jgi:arabinoxylan arabinofuranohydrolase
MAIKCLCSGLLLTAIVLLGDVNVLTNPGFEEGITGWAGRSCEIEAVSSPVHSGSGAAKATGRTEAWQGIKQSILGKVANGKTYKISGWVRLENSDSDSVTVSIEQADDNGTKYINVAGGAASNTEWTEISGEFTLDAAGDLKTLDVYFEGPVPEVNFIVDDVSVSGEAPAAPAVPAEPNAPKDEPNAPKAEPNEPI